MTRRTYARGLVAVCLVFAIILGIIAALRPADIDEGYFVASAAFVEQGQRPYHDFLFPQMPVMAYLPAAVTNLLPARTLPWARAIFVLFSAGAVALFGVLALKLCGDTTIAFLAVILFAGCELIHPWFPTVKPHALVTLLMLAGFFFSLQAEGRTRSIWSWSALSGIAWGLALSTRLLVAPALPLVALWLALRRGTPAVLGFAGGALIGLLPVWVLALPDPALFLFHNLGYHAEARSTSLVADLPQKVYILLSLIASAQAGILFVLAIVGTHFEIRGAHLRKWLAGPHALAFALLIVLGGVYILPTPTYTQYYSSLVPFLLILALPALARIPRTPLIWLGVGLYLCAAPVYFYREVTKWSGDPEYSLQSMRTTDEAVESACEKDEALLDFWGYHVWATQRPPYPRAAGWTAIQTGRVLGDRRAREVNAPELGRILADLRARRIPAVVWAGTVALGPRRAEVRAVLDKHYEKVHESKGVVVFRALPAP